MYTPKYRTLVSLRPSFSVFRFSLSVDIPSSIYIKNLYKEGRSSMEDKRRTFDTTDDVCLLPLRIEGVLALFSEYKPTQDTRT